MCGVVGWVDFDRNLTGERATILAMTATMALRGPDAEGVWLADHVGLGHRRLAVIDLVGGGQPMTADRDGVAAAAITYSGEVYNYRELRTELAGLGHRFRPQSDTEVVLRAYLQWGEAFVERLNGMFAFGPAEHGARPGGAGALLRPPAGRVRVQHALVDEDPRRAGEERL